MMTINGIEVKLLAGDIGVFLDFPEANPYPSVEWNDFPTTYDLSEPQKPKSSQVSFNAWTANRDTLITSLQRKHYADIELFGRRFLVRIQSVEVSEKFFDGCGIQIEGFIDDFTPFTHSINPVSSITKSVTPTTTSSIHILDYAKLWTDRVEIKQGAVSASGYQGGTHVIRDRIPFSVPMLMKCKTSEMWAVRDLLRQVLFSSGGISVVIDGNGIKAEYQNCKTSQAIVQGDNLWWEFLLSFKTL